jgi:hypothetical protein
MLTFQTYSCYLIKSTIHKNQKTQSLTNQRLKDEIEKKKNNIKGQKG